jgi:predicted transposase YbfD/YdcC
MAEEQLRAWIAVKLVATHFAALDDPRVDRTKLHPLLNVLVFALTGALCGAVGWEELEEFAEDKRHLFEGVLDLSNGTPSADTFRRVLGALHPVQFEKCFTAWVAALGEELAGKVVAFDGKAMRNAVRRTAAGTFEYLHLLHAWVSDSHLLLAAEAVEGSPGEVKALPGLIRSLQVEGAVVTTDANGCTRAVAEACQESGADYALALKGNRGNLYTQVVKAFEEVGLAPYGTHVTREEAHGRWESRRISALPLTDWPLKGSRWPGAATVVRVERLRQGGVQASLDYHYYLTSLPPDCERLSQVIRAHWGVENGLHWVLDVAFGEDTSRIRDQTAAHNLGLVNRMALNLLKRDTTVKRGIAAKRRKAGRNDAFLLHLLSLGITHN